LPGGTVTQPFTLPQGGCCAAFSADARYMLVNLPNHGVGTKELWDVQKGARRIDMGQCDSDSIPQAFSRDGRFFAIGPCLDKQQSNFTVQIWDLPAGRMLHEIVDPPVPNFSPDWSSAAFSPDGTEIALGDDLGRILIWDLSSYKLLQSLNLQ
jgi:WD40 repeat protein